MKEDNINKRKKLIRRIAAAIFCMLLMLNIMPAFADNELYEVDPFTNQIISDISGNGSESVGARRLTTNCTYDTDSRKFVYSMGDNSSVYFTSTVFSGECVSETVTIDARNAANTVVYRDGEALEETNIYDLKDAGFYSIKNSSSDEDVMSFEILPEYVSSLNRFEVPSLYYIVNASADGKKISAGNMNYVKLENEGAYSIKYSSTSLGISRTVTFTVDRTAPVLEITGVEDGYASGPVTIGEREEGSSLEVLLNGEETSVKDKYTAHGNYHFIYTDAAGNVSSSSFTIKMYLDINAGIVIGIFAAIVIGVAVYMIHLRKHMRTC